MPYHLGKVALTAILVLGSSISAEANVVLYSTFGPGDSYNCCQGTTVSGAASISGYNALGQQFSVPVTATVSTIELALFVFNSPFISRPVDDSLQIALNADNGGRPGSILESYVIGNLPFVPAQIVEIASTTKTLLLSDKFYWITAVPLTDTTTGGWNDSLPIVTGLSIQSNDPNFATGTPGDFSTGQGAFRITGTIPEPATLTLFGVWLFGLRLARSRTRFTLAFGRRIRRFVQGFL